MSDEKSPSGRLSRRRLLALAAAGGAVAVAGCLGGDGEDVPEPVALEDGQACDHCQMVITNHPGPVGQAYYLDDPPEDLPDDRENGIARFCSSWCTYTYVREHEQGGPSPAGIYTTDYSTVEYELFEDAGATVISAHFAADAFARGSELRYAVNSDVEGAMGPSLVGFSNADDAEAFVNEYGGKVLGQGDITLGIVRGM